MGFDIYCAVCGGPACAHITIDDKSRKAAVREKREVDPSFSEKDLNRREFRGYDPEVVSPEDVQWTYKAQVLGFNPNATGIDNYRVYDATQTACYPIHEPCLKLLTRVLCGNDNIDNLDKDTLYHTISGLMGWDLPKLDYGEPSVEHDQCWWSKPGEETANAKMMVIYPLSNPTFTTLLRNTVSTDDFALPTPPGTTDPATSASLSARVRRDPFAGLPYDITHQILLLLPAEAVPRLATASYPVHAAVRSSARNPGFWRQALRRCMPWFWELHVLMRHGTVDPEETDFKGLFLWLEACTRPRRGLEGPFMGVANRRRVWGVCEQYDALYVRRIRMTNGKDVKLGDTSPTHCQRLLPISSDHVLVGIMGQLTKADEDNRMRITRLGLLQHPHPDSAILSPSSPSETTPPQLPLLHQPLWTSPPTAAAAAATTPLHNPSHPIWSNNSTLRALPSTDRPLLRYQIQNPWHEDIVPTHPLIFAANEFERRNLARLTAWLCDDGRHVCCVRVEYRAESRLAPREVGPAAVRRMEADEGEKIVGIALAFTFGRRKEDIAHRWDDGSDMVLRERLQLSWLATLVAKE
ncbi:putative f-box domain protein [Diplodia seriata]|uniref:Putative f-box domain protein n=1 Tax=Diplodia seriata TaxID=420778 RepID=A0A0G2FMM7_9PEZI|nr:putative f-box domain protein [Diplodia seriata]